MVIDEKMLEKYKKYLIEEEKSKNTVEKYMRDIKMFYQFSFGREITKELSIDYKKMLEMCIRDRSPTCRVYKRDKWY